MKTIYLYILFFIGISLPAFTAGQTTLDEGFTTIRVVEIDEPGSIVKCLPVGVELHAPDDPQREAIVMKAGIRYFRQRADFDHRLIDGN